MKRIFITLFMSVIALSAITAQSRYCLSYDDWRAGVWHNVSNLTVEQRSKSAKFWWGGGDWKFATGNAEEESILKKQAFLVQMDTVLFVNLRKYKCEKTLFGKNFAHAYIMNDSTLLFPYIGIGNKESSDAMAAQFAFGIIGGLAAANSQSKHTAVYTISDATKKTKRLSMEDMEKLLAPYPKVLNDFYDRSKADEYQAPVAIECLRRAGLLRR